MSLRDLDDRLLPLAAARARAAVDRYLALQRRAGGRLRALDLDALDRRWARGPLRVLHARPLVGLVVVALVAAAGVGVVLHDERAPAPVQAGPGVTDRGPSYDDLRGATLGPQVGTTVAAYVRTSTEGLVKAVQTEPTTPRVALVSLATYLTPEGAAVVLNGYATARVFVRAPAAGANATPFPVEVRGNVLSSLRKAYADTARSRATAARSYQGFVDTLKGSSKEDENFRRLYAGFAKASGIEAKAYAADCACVYAALVLANPTQLLTLRARAGVRVLQIAPKGFSSGQVQVQPLLPEVTGTVPRPAVAGQS